MKSIRTSLLVPLVGGIILLSTTAAVFLYASMHGSLMSQFRDSLRTKATSLGSLVHLLPDGRLDFDYTESDFPEFRRRKRPEYFQIVLSDGTTIQRSESLGTRSLSSKPDSAEMFEPVKLPDGRPGRLLALTRRATFDEDEFQAAGKSFPKQSARPPLPTITIVVASDTESMDQTLARLRIYLVLTVLLLTLGVALIVPAIVRRSLRPLDAIAEHANSLSLGSLESAFPENNLPAELAPISRRLNELLDRLTASFAREARFSANAAHELRTPIAEIRTVAEVAMQWPDLTHAQRALNEIVDVSTRMESLTEALLNLARARAGHIASHAGPVDVLAIARQMVALLEPAVRERRLNIAISDSSGALARTDPILCRALVSNLVSNAIYHGSIDGDVSLTESVTDARLTLAIVNDCSDLAAADLALVREPFWTGSSSRTEQAHGLGLALASEYARFLKATFSVELTAAHEFRAMIGFPISTDTTTELRTRDVPRVHARPASAG